jgi:hypothetical protein
VSRLRFGAASQNAAVEHMTRKYAEEVASKG